MSWISETHVEAGATPAHSLGGASDATGVDAGDGQTSISLPFVNPRPSLTKQHDCATVLSTHADPLDQAAQATLACVTGGLSPASMTLAYLDWAMHLGISPRKWLDLTLDLTNALSAAATRSVAAPRATQAAADAAGDPRFGNAAWTQWPYCIWRDGFLRIEHWWHEASTGVPGVSRHHEDMVSFGARQWLDAFSPSNFAALNPFVLETAVRTGGANFAAGARHWVEDFDDIARALRGDRAARKSAYRPGHELAITPGKVVWRNGLCELLQYTPRSARVAREPIFIVPSWVMKYYILDPAGRWLLLRRQCSRATAHVTHCAR
jgi:poly[(R)-3-hydroxyalkanoate] polymerase subunit PhaC